MSLTLAFVMMGLSGAVGAFSAFVISYMNEKGKNLATKEDVEKLVAQMSAVTKATKEIEAKISGEMWDRQKRWELKREVLFDASKRTGDLSRALTTLYGTYSHYEKLGENGGSDLKAAAQTNWCNALGELSSATTLVGLVCSAKTKDAFFDLYCLMGEVGNKVVNGNAEAFTECLGAYGERMEGVTRAIRQEIEL